MSHRAEQTRAVKRLAAEVERITKKLRHRAEQPLTLLDLDHVQQQTADMATRAHLATHAATARAVGGTATCQRHADAARAAGRDAYRLAEQIARQIEAERIRRADEFTRQRETLERDHPALAAITAGLSRHVTDAALALVMAGDYRQVEVALSRFRACADWAELDLPRHPEELVVEEIDARELAGIMAAYDPDLDEADSQPGARIQHAARALGWAPPAEVWPDAAHTFRWSDSAPVHGGTDDHEVAEAATLAIARYGVFDDTGNPTESHNTWDATVLCDVWVWLPHVEAWRRDPDPDSETLVMRQMDRAMHDWEDWGKETYIDAYVYALADEILDHEGPATLGEEWDSGVDRDEYEEAVEERARELAEELDPGLTDADVDFPLYSDEIADTAKKHAKLDYEQQYRPSVPPENTTPLF